MHDDHEPSPDERRVRDAVRDLPRPPVDAAFRARLRHEFVTGRIGRRRGLTFERPWFLRAFVLAPAAAVALAVVCLASNRGPDWQVQSADGAGRVVVNGTSFAADDIAHLTPALRRGGRVLIEGAVTLDLMAPGLAAVALAPGADLHLSPSPNRWWNRHMQADLSTGDAYFATGRLFHGAHLDVVTQHARVRAVGTSFAVLSGEFGTCVCVMEGRVRVGEHDAAPGEGVDVPEGMRRTFHPGLPPETGPILDDSAHLLHRQLETAGSALGR